MENSKAIPDGQLPVCYSRSESDDLARFILRCDRQDRDLKATRKAYQQCLGDCTGTESWWQNPYFVMGGIGMSFGIGVLLATVL